jgi:uncharacterized protein (TIRG00374 family)
MTRKRQLIVAAGILVSAVFLFLAFQNLRPADFSASLREVNLLWLLVGAVVYFGAVTVISLRWGYLLRAVKVVSLRDLIPLVCIGYMGNNVYPFRSGEVLRIVLLRRNHGVPVTKATTVVIVERVFDGLVMLAFIAVSLLFVNIQSDEIRTVAVVATPIFLTAIAVFFILAARPNLLRRLVILVSRPLPDKLESLITRLSEEIIHGLEALRSPADLAGAIVTSFASWGIEALVYWIVMWAFGLQLGYPVALLAVGTVNLAGLIPASPGQIGVYEFFVSTVMAAAGARDVALAYAIVVHIVIWLPVTLAGFYFLARQGLGWQAITHARELEQTAVSS